MNNTTCGNYTDDGQFIDKTGTPVPLLLIPIRNLQKNYGWLLVPNSSTIDTEEHFRFFLYNAEQSIFPSNWQLCETPEAIAIAWTVYVWKSFEQNSTPIYGDYVCFKEGARLDKQKQSLESFAWLLESAKTLPAVKKLLDTCPSNVNCHIITAMLVRNEWDAEFIQSLLFPLEYKQQSTTLVTSTSSLSSILPQENKIEINRSDSSPNTWILTGSGNPITIIASDAPVLSNHQNDGTPVPPGFRFTLTKENDKITVQFDNGYLQIFQLVGTRITLLSENTWGDPISQINFLKREVVIAERIYKFND